MKKYFLKLALLISAFAFFSGCQYNRSRDVTTVAPTQQNDERLTGITLEETSEQSDETDVPTYESVEDFYQSLPCLELPLTWKDGQFEKMQPVPPGIYLSPAFGLEYEYELVLAARLPEIDGIRSIIVTIEDMGEYITRYLYTYRAEDMENTDRLVIYNVREIDGGQNTLITSAEIYEGVLIDLTTTYSGNGEKGEFVKILFGHNYYRPEPDGKIESVFDMSLEVIKYTEELYRDEADGEYYGTYKFTVTTSQPAPTEEEDVYRMKEYNVQRYMVNEEGWLVMVDSFE